MVSKWQGFLTNQAHLTHVCILLRHFNIIPPPPGSDSEQTTLQTLRIPIFPASVTNNEGGPEHSNQCALCDDGCRSSAWRRRPKVQSLSRSLKWSWMWETSTTRSENADFSWSSGVMSPPADLEEAWFEPDTCLSRHDPHFACQTDLARCLTLFLFHAPAEHSGARAQIKCGHWPLKHVFLSRFPLVVRARCGLSCLMTDLLQRCNRCLLYSEALKRRSTT